MIAALSLPKVAILVLLVALVIVSMRSGRRGQGKR